MAEKNIISKPFAITRREGSTALKDIFYVETRGKQSGNTFLPPDGKSSADLDVYRQITLDEYNGVLVQGGENQNLLKVLPSTNPNETREIFLIKDATIQNNQVIPTALAPERIQRNANLPEFLLSPSIQSSEQSIKDSGLTNNANISPNKATQNETTSTPINVPISQADVNLGSSSIKTYPINMKDDQDRIEFTVLEYSNRSLTSPDILTVGKPGFKKVEGSPTIYLPITKISDTNTVNWSEDGLNELQKGLADLSFKAMVPGGEPIDQGKELMGMTSDEGFGSLVRLSLAGQAVGLNNLLTRATGALLNPNLELLFQGPLLRQFGFGFDLLAKSKNEADRIKEIIKFFKQNMAVRDDVTGFQSTVPGSSSKNLFLNSPYVFKIRYISGSTEHRSIGRVKECALQSCTTDYTPMGTYMTFNDTEKTMFMYRINLQFKELTPVYSSDYDDHPIGY